MRGWKLVLATALVANVAPVAAQTKIVMPIAKGFWTNETEKCATVRYGYIFDGARWGSLYYYGPTGNLGPAAELRPITQTRAVGGGYIQMQFGGFDGASYFRMKSLAPNRANYRIGAPFREEMQITNEVLIRCDYAAVSPKMQVAIKRFAPELATVK